MSLSFQMTSVERVMEYTKLEPEASLESHEVKPDPKWPTDGAISFDMMSLAYSSDSPLVLKNITCDIRPREKVCSLYNLKVSRIA